VEHIESCFTSCGVTGGIAQLPFWCLSVCVVVCSLVAHQYLAYLYKPVLQERSILEANNYCRLVHILIAEAHATPGGGTSIIDSLQKHTSYFHKNPVFITILKIGSLQASIARKKHPRRKELLYTIGLLLTISTPSNMTYLLLKGDY
jgi:hypothetical protein